MGCIPDRGVSHSSHGGLVGSGTPCRHGTICTHMQFCISAAFRIHPFACPSVSSRLVQLYKQHDPKFAKAHTTRTSHLPGRSLSPTQGTGGGGQPATATVPAVPTTHDILAHMYIIHRTALAEAENILGKNASLACFGHLSTCQREE